MSICMVVTISLLPSFPETPKIKGYTILGDSITGMGIKSPPTGTSSPQRVIITMSFIGMVNVRRVLRR